MSNGCNWRYLTADGTVDACWGEGFKHPEPVPNCDDLLGHGPCWDHTSGRGAWDEGDPCAFEASTCLACSGDGVECVGQASWVQKPDGTSPDVEVRCPSCGGSGTVDTPPPALIGPGSIVTPAPDHWRYGHHVAALKRMLVSDRGGSWSTALYRHRGEPGDRHLHVPLDLSGWRVLRAVPPAGDDT